MTTGKAAGKANTIRKMFIRETEIFTDIHSEPGILWTLLTQAQDIPRWNTTILSIEGDIRPGGRIRLRAALSPKRVFALKIKEWVPEKRLVWGDAMGQRTFTLEPLDPGKLRFTMKEKIGGPLFPMFAGMIPSFDKAFEQFASDLKQEAEAIFNLNS